MDDETMESEFEVQDDIVEEDDADVEPGDDVVLEAIETIDTVDDEDDDIDISPAKKDVDHIIKKSAKAASTPAAEALDAFGPVRKAFILDTIRTIDYVDIATLIGVKAEDLKKAVEEMGIKLPIERARKWSDIDVGTYKSIENCSRCQVQLNHSAFYVDINECRACLTKNISYWINKGIKIHLMFGRN